MHPAIVLYYHIHIPLVEGRIFITDHPHSALSRPIMVGYGWGVQWSFLSNDCSFLPSKQLLRHGIGLSTSSDSEMITQLLAYTPPQEQDDTPDWVAR